MDTGLRRYDVLTKTYCFSPLCPVFVYQAALLPKNHQVLQRQRLHGSDMP